MRTMQGAGLASIRTGSFEVRDRDDAFDPLVVDDRRAAHTVSTDAQGNPVPNTTRDLWVTATSLTTALNTSFLAERIALFSIVMGVALLLTGVGFLVLTIAVLRPEKLTESAPQAA